MSRRNVEKCSHKFATQKESESVHDIHLSPWIGKKDATAVLAHDFGKRNDRAARIAGDGLEVSFASRRLFLLRGKIARCCILTRRRVL